MNLKKLVFPRGTIKEGDQGEKVIPFFKTVLQYLNVSYTDICCDESFSPLPAGYNVVGATYSEVVTAVSTNSLVVGDIYHLTDKNLFLIATTSGLFNPIGAKVMYCPADYALHTDAYGNVWKGVWRSTGTYAINDLVIWGNQVWKNTTGAAGTSTNITTLNGANWVLIPSASFTNHEYVLLSFGVYYDVATDWISRQWDSKGNELGCSKTQWAVISALSNPSDISDWNNPLIRDNKVWAIFNNSYISATYQEIKYNSNVGAIYNNQVLAGGFGIAGIFENTNTGSIYDNTKPSIRGNSNKNQIQANSGNEYIVNNSCAKAITSNSSSRIEYNSNNGEIRSNSSGNISLNSNNGGISQNSCSGVISANNNNGNINYNANLGSISFNSNGGNISNFSNSASSYAILNNNYTSNMLGTGFTLTANVDGKTPKVISTATYTLLPWDWNNVYTYVGDVTLTVASAIPIPHSSSHVKLGTGDIIVSPAGGVTVSNYSAHTKSNGQYSPIALYNTTLNNFILGGNTKA